MSVASVANIVSLPQLSPAATRQLTSPPVPVMHFATPAVYATPVYKFDNQADIPVELIRDPSTGAVLNQFPSAQIVEKYRRHELPQATSNSGPESTPLSMAFAVSTGTPQASPAISSGSSTSIAAPAGGSSSSGAGPSASTSSVSISV